MTEAKVKAQKLPLTLFSIVVSWSHSVPIEDGASSGACVAHGRIAIIKIVATALITSIEN